MYPTKPLGEISKLIMGQSPKSETYNLDKNGLPFYQGKKEFGKIFPTPEVWCSEPIKIVEKNDILISVRAPVGPTNLCQETSCIGRGLAGIRPNYSTLELGFLRYFFKKYEEEISKLGKGSTFSSITKSDLENLQIPLPPFSTQQKIVSKLDNLFSKIDKNIELTKQNIANIDEENNAILEKIFKECEKEFGSEEIGRICNIITGNTPSTQFSEYYGGEILWVGPSDFGDFKIINSTQKTLTEKGLIEGKARLVKKGSVLLVSIGATIGKLGIAGINLTTNQQVNSFEVSEKILGDFLYYFLKFYKKNFVNFASQTTLPIVNKTQCSKIQIPLPPLQKQQEIVKYLDNIFAKNSELKNFYEKNLKNLEELKQSILKQAFEDENFIK